MRNLRLPIRALAVVALTGSGVAGVLLAMTSPAEAIKAPVAASCTGISAQTTASALASGGPVTALVTGCSGGKTSPQGVDIYSVNSQETGGTGTIYWTDKKITTYTYSISNGSFSCPTFLGQPVYEEENVTTTNVGGNAKITANGSSELCLYAGTDGSVYEDGPAGTGTI